jgi:glycerophosphoryl diester phosphodiesterase
MMILSRAARIKIAAAQLVGVTLVFLFFLFCNPIASMWPYPKLVAHRGAGRLAPENTLAAIHCGLAHGFRAVEFDVMLAGDGIPVLMHDPVLGRTVAGIGNVADYSARELATMDAGSWFGARFAGEPVPSYESVAAFCKTKHIWMNVEIKPAPGADTSTGRAVAELTARMFASEIAAHAAGGSIATLPLLSSFSLEALLAAQAAAPAVPRAVLVDAIQPDWRARLEASTAVALHVNHRRLSAAQANAIKQAGYGLFCYTVNDPERARKLLSWGVDAFCTDRIDLMGPDFLRSLAN